MKIRLVEINKDYGRRWKIESQWSKAFNVWENYFYPKDILYLSYEDAKKDYDSVVNRTLTTDNEKILEMTEI